MAPSIDVQQVQQQSRAAATSEPGSSSSVLTTAFPVVCLIMAFIFVIGIHQRLQVCSLGRRIQRFLGSHTSSAPAELPPCRLQLRDVDAIQATEYVYSSPSPSLNGKDGDDSCGRDWDCAICSEDFVSGAVLRKLRCRHLFHKNCIDLWFRGRSATCPLWYAYIYLENEKLAHSQSETQTKQ